MIINKEDFLKYERAKYTATNMINNYDIAEKTGLNILKITEIRANYDKLKKQLYDEDEDRFYVRNLIRPHILKIIKKKQKWEKEWK